MTAHLSSPLFGVPETDFSLVQKLLTEFVAAPTFRPNPTFPLAEKIVRLAHEFGVDDARYIPSRDNQGEHSGVILHFGPKDRAPLAFSGHLDVVGVKGEEGKWQSDPFTLTERNGNLYGRGTSDMKGYVAVTLATLFAWKQAACAFANPVQILLTHDEETGFKSVHEVTSQLLSGKQLPRPKGVIVGEPTEMKVFTAHKGCFRFRIDIEGAEGHSAYPELGVSATDILGELIVAGKGYADRSKADGIRRASENGDDPYYLTLNAGIAEGGTAATVIAGRARYLGHARQTQNLEVEQMEGFFEDQFKALTEKYRTADGKAPSFRFTRELVLPPLERRAANYARDVAFAAQGSRAETSVNYGTEACIYQSYGISAIVQGPGSIERAHKPNEFIAADELRAAARFQQQVILHHLTH
jgi:acetylornithine deacetylase